MRSLLAIIVFCVVKSELLSKPVVDNSYLYDKYDNDLFKSLVKGADNIEFEHFNLKEKVKILRDMLRTECKEISSLFKRGLEDDDVRLAKAEVERVLYERMIRMLVACRKRKLALSATSSLPPRTTATTSSLPPRTTTTTSSLPPETTKATATPALTTRSFSTTTFSSLIPDQPEECQSAINLTEAWRKYPSIKSGSGQNCDLRVMGRHGRPWFRFAGEAGNKMLDRCPPSNRCGTAAGMWTDNAMPSTIGVNNTIQAYGSWEGNCKRWVKSVNVMKCSNQTSDYIYKYIDPSETCSLGFCGMLEIN